MESYKQGDEHLFISWTQLAVLLPWPDRRNLMELLSTNKSSSNEEPSCLCWSGSRFAMYTKLG